MRVISKLFRKDEYDPKYFDDQINGINELRIFVAQDKFISMLFKALINPVLFPPHPSSHSYPAGKHLPTKQKHAINPLRDIRTPIQG